MGVNHAMQGTRIFLWRSISGRALVPEGKKCKCVFKRTIGCPHSMKYMHSMLYELPPFLPSSSGAGRMNAGGVEITVSVDSIYGMRDVNFKLRQRSNVLRTMKPPTRYIQYLEIKEGSGLISTGFPSGLRVGGTRSAGL
jgi:hypothetical protein